MKYRKDRLIRIAEHLEKGKLGHSKFSFSEFNSSLDGFDAKGCGTSGCAVGEFPFIFPRSWAFNFRHLPSPKSKVSLYCSVVGEVSKFLNLPVSQVEGLFIPSDPSVDAPWNPTKRSPGRRATRRQVAAAIRRFIAWRDSGADVNA